MRGGRSATLQQAFVNYFGGSEDGPDREAVATVADTLSRMRDAVAGYDADNLLCTARSDCDDELLAYTDASGSRVVVCETIISEGEAERRELEATLIHESAHVALTGRTTDIYAHDPLFRLLDEIPSGTLSGSPASLYNPDSLTHFVLSIADEERQLDEAPEAALREPRSGADPGLTEERRETVRLVRAEAALWLHWAEEDIFLDSTEELRREIPVPDDLRDPLKTQYEALRDRAQRRIEVDYRATLPGGEAVTWSVRPTPRLGSTPEQREEFLHASNVLLVSDAFFSAERLDQVRSLLLALYPAASGSGALAGDLASFAAEPPRSLRFVFRNAERHAGL